MGHQIIKQPDGKLCVWSDVVGSLILRDMTAEDLVQYYARAAYENMRRNTERVTDMVLAGKAVKIYHETTLDYYDVIRMSDTNGKGQRRTRRGVPQ